jgi:AraC-like DNA-binding protein
MRHLKLQPGFEVSILEFQINRDLQVEVQFVEPSFTFGCLLEGETPCDFADGRRQPRSSGVTLWAGLGTERFASVHTNPVRYASVTVSADFLRRKSDPAGLPMSSTVARALEHPHTRTAIYSGELTRETRAAIRMLMHAKANETIERLRVESIALNILCGRLEALSGPQHRSSAERPLRAADLERVREVRRILSEHPEHSPTLAELARKVGTNECSLRSDFRRAFGVTIYEFLRDQRMLLADRMLGDGRWHVAEVAEKVGYQCPSRFSAAYRQRFGVSPKRRRLSVMAADS